MQQSTKLPLRVCVNRKLGKAQNTDCLDRREELLFCVHAKRRADALRMLDSGYFGPASLDTALHEIEEECPDATVAALLVAARMRYRLHEGSLAGIRHGSEEYRAWMAERKQVFCEMRRALSRALLEAAV